MTDAENLEVLIIYEIFAEGLRKDIPTCVLLVVLRVIQDIQYIFPRVLGLHTSVFLRYLWLEMGMYRFAEASEESTGRRDNTHPTRE
jgi:hypothetical protein